MNKQVGVKLVPCGGSEILRAVFQTRSAAGPTGGGLGLHGHGLRERQLRGLDAGEMLDQIRGKALLAGFRGDPPADREALVDTLLRVSRMVTDLPEIAELDLNPLVALPPGRGVVAVDARIRVRSLASAPVLERG